MMGGVPGYGPRLSTRTGRSAQLPMAIISACATGVLIAGCYLDRSGLVVAIAVVQVALVLGWLLSADAPGRVGSIMIGLAAAAGSDYSLYRWSEHGYEPVLPVLGLAVVAMFAHQLSRFRDRTRVVESLSDLALLTVAVVAIGGLLLLRQQGNGDRTTLAVVSAVGAGLIAAHLVDAVLPVPRYDPAVDRGFLATVIGAVVGGVVSLLVLRQVIDFSNARSALVGAVAALVACLLSVGATFAGAHSSVTIGAARLRPLVGALMTISLSVPAGYVLINALSA
ncbi:MAG: conserved rane protein of unknown function [Frankiales bacterium]|nr:conserved rane protein of unknown function [Frankiales bacterium]